MKWGNACGKKVMQRLDDIKAAENLKILCTLPGRCHALKGDRHGQWSLDLKHPLRLLFAPSNYPLCKMEDGSLDLEKVTVVTIIEVEDTHG